MLATSSGICGFLIPPRKQDFNNIFNKKSIEMLERTLSDIVSDTHISKEAKFQSLLSFRINIEDITNFSIDYDKNIEFSVDDKERLIQWIIKYNSNSIGDDSYLGEFFRIELQNYILLTQVYNLENKQQIFIGYLLKNDLATRLDLAECYQSFLFKKML
jgi:hypothetical protein